MSSNPFDDIFNAFRPMFTDSLSAICKRNNLTMYSEISCCVFPIDDVDPFEDSTAKSDIKRLNVLIQYNDWFNNATLSSIEPEIGDSLIIDNQTWKISKVEKELDNWNIESRNV